MKHVWISEYLSKYRHLKFYFYQLFVSPPPWRWKEVRFAEAVVVQPPNIRKEDLTKHRYVFPFLVEVSPEFLVNDTDCQWHEGTGGHHVVRRQTINFLRNLPWHRQHTVLTITFKKCVSCLFNKIFLEHIIFSKNNTETSCVKVFSNLLPEYIYDTISVEVDFSRTSVRK